MLSLAIGLLAASSAVAANYYWTGTSPGGAFWNTTIGGSNWSIDPNTPTDPGNSPTSTSDVFFVFNPETNPTTTLGQDFSIKGLTFTTDASSPVTIGGANTLTIGADGLTLNSPASDVISANVAIGAVETWANNSPSPTTLTVSGQISGSSALTLEGTGSTSTPSGAFIFSGNNSFSGALTLLNANTSLTLNGSGTIASVSSITLGGGTSLVLDDTAASAARLDSAASITSNGGTISLIGNGTNATSDGFGALTLSAGTTRVNVTSNGPTATLSLNSITRSPGSSINFGPTSSTAVVALTNSTLTNGILGPWATIGDLSGAGNLDWATVNSGNVVAYSGYNTSTTPSTWPTTNVKVSSTVTLTASANPGSLYLTGPAVIGSSSTSNTITLGSGGVIVNGGTGTGTFSGGVATTGVVFLGGSTSGSGTNAAALNAAVGVPDIVFNVAGTYSNANNPSAANNGVLEIGGIIKDGPSPAGQSATTTTGSNVVMVSSTTQLYPGVTVTGLTGLTGTQTITSILDATHFTVGSNATTGGSAAATFTSHTGITKNGGGMLDLSNFNNTSTAFTYTGPVTINGGAIVVKNANQLGATPAANTPNLIVFNGGDLRMVGTITISSRMGMFVGPQGGQLSYTGGNTTHLSSFQMTGPGSVQFTDIPQYHTTSNNSAAIALDYAAGTMSYSGGTTLFTQAADAFPNPVGAVIFFTNDNEIPALSPVTVTNVLANNTVNNGTGGIGIVNMNGHSATWGSLAGNGDIVTDQTALQTITVGGNNLSTTYSGNLGHGGLTWSVGAKNASGDQSSSGNTGGSSGTNIALVKNGTGIMTLSAASGSDYSGGTTINNGSLRVTNASGSATGTGPVTINGTATTSGALGGPGIVAGLVTVNNLGQLTPTLTGSGATTLQLQGGLTLNGGSILNFNLGAVNPSGLNSSPTSDNVFVTGALTVGTGTDTINVASVGSGLHPDTYQLIQASSVPTDFSGTTFNVNGPLQFSYQVVDDTTNDSLDLVVTNNPNKFFTWVGAPGNGTWDLDPSNKPWTFTGSGGSFAYTDGAFLTFDNTPGQSSNITIATNVAPGSMTFNNNLLVSYTFGGPGQITGSIGFVKKNTGSVTFNNVNTFTGLADIQNGSIIVGATGSLADSSFAVAAGASLSVAGSIPATATITNAGSVAFSNASQTLATISGAGSLALNGTALTIANTSTYGGSISGTGSLTTPASGSLTLSNTNSYSGGTSVGPGSTLIVTNSTGSGTGSGTVTVGGTLRGTGAVAGPIVVNAGGLLQPSGAGTWGSTVNLSGAFTPAGPGVAGAISLGATTINSGAALNYDLGTPAASDTANVPALSTSGNVTVNLNGLVGFNQGQYTLVTSTAAISDSASYTVVGTGSLAGYPAGDFSVTHDSNHVFVNITFPSTPNVWTGATNNAWDTATINWSSASGLFSTGDKAQFDDTNTSGNNAIAIDAGGVSPSQVVFANSTQDYSINGPGVITGVASITKSGSGTATINTINTNLGPTTITGGTLAIIDDGSLGTAPTSTIANQLTINGGQLMTLATTTLATTRGIQVGNAAGMIGANATTGGTINVSTGITTYNGVISDVTGQSGILNKDGPGELDLGGTNTFSGGMKVINGTAKLTSTGAGGISTITVNPNGTLDIAAAPAAGGASIILAGGTIASSSGTQGLNNDMTAANGTTSTVDLFDPLAPTNKFDLDLGSTTAGVTGTAALHGAGNINLVAAPGANTPESAAFRLRGAASDFSGTITVGQTGKFELQSLAQGNAAGTGTIVLTGGAIDATNNGTFSLFNIRNISTTASVVYGNNVAVTGTGTVILNQLGGAAGLTNTFGNLDVGDGQFVATSATTGTALQTIVFPTVTTEGGTVTFQPGIPGNTNYIIADNFSLGTISESGTSTGTTVALNGNGILTLTSANSYTGGTTVNAGTLRLGAPGALPAGTSLVVNGGTVDLNNAGTSNSQSVGSLAGTGGAVTNSDATTTRTLTVTGATSTSYSGALAGNLQLVMNAPGGALALSGANTYSGGTLLTAGTLNINGSSAISSGTLVIGAGTAIGNTSGNPVLVATNNLQTWNGSFSFSGTSDLNIGTGAVTMFASPTVTVASNTLTVAGSIGDGGAGLGLTKDGPGTLALAGANTFSGGMTVTAGTLLLSGTTTSSAATTVNGGILAVTNVSGSATGSGTVNVASGGTLAGTGQISGQTVVNNLGHVSPGIGAGGIGTLHLAATNLNAGSVLDYDLAGLAAYDSTAAGPLTLGANLTVNIDAESGFSLGTYNLVTSTGRTGSPTFTVNHSGPGDNPNFTYNVTTQGNNIVLIVAATAQKWTGAQNNNWDTTTANWDPAVHSGLYADNLNNQVFDDSGTNTNINIVSTVSPLGVLFANNLVPYTIGGADISGSTAVVIQGPGSVTLNSLNTYTGGTTLLGGTLNLGNPQALGSGTLAISGGTIDNTSGSSMSIPNSALWSGSFTFVGSSDLTIGGATVTLTATPTVTVASGTLTINASIVDSGAGYGFTKDGPGTMVLLEANSYGGTTTLLAGNLNIVSGGTLGSGSAPLTVSGGTLDLGGSTQNVGPVNISGGSVQNGTLTASSFNVTNSADMTISANLAGAAVLTKSNTGTLTLSGTGNSYSGGTVINGGTVSIAGDSVALGTNLGAIPATVQPANITLNGGTLQVTAGTAANAGAGNATLNVNRGITLGASGGTINIGFVDTAQNVAPATNHLGSEIALVYNGVITGPGGLTVTGQAGIDQAEASILDLGAIATYQGNTTINSAIAQVNSGTSGANNAAAIVNVLPTGTVLNLVNNGAWNIDSTTSALTVAGLNGDASGRFGTTNLTNAAVLTIGGAGSYLFPGIIGANTVAGKLGSDAEVSLVMNGTGTQVLSGPNTYAGGTTVTSGTLTTTSTGTIGNGPLTVSAADTITSVMNIGSNQPITSLAGTVAGSGSARVNVAAGVTLTDSQATNTTFAGTLALGGGATANSGGTFTMNGNTQSTLEIQGAPSLGNNSNINLNGTYTLRFNVTAGSPVVGTGVQANVQNGATLELAGTVSALSQASGGRVNVNNTSNAVIGLHVTGTNQQVGGVDGTGTTQVEAGASLTANHIVQGALVIGGTAGSPALVTIAPSDASGNPLASSGGLAVAGSIAPGGSGSTLVSTSVGSSSSPASGSLTAAGGLGSSMAASGLNLGGGTAAVPEPSTLVIAIIAFASLGCLIRRKRS